MNVKTSYIDVNRLNASNKEGDETNSWTLDLNKNFSLPTGSEISIHQSFINQKGILGDSIEIEENIEERINCHLYLTDEFHPIGDQTPHSLRQHPNLYINAGFLFNQNGVFEAGTPTEYITSIYGTPNPAPYRHFGGSKTPFIYYQMQEVGGTRVMTPVTITRSFTIKKGVYGINQLADLITDQINGKVFLDTFTNEYVRTNPAERNQGAGTFDGDLSQAAGLVENFTLLNQSVYNYDNVANGTLSPANNSFSRFFIPNFEHRNNTTNFKGQVIQRDYDTYVAENRSLLVLVDNQRPRNTNQQHGADVETTLDYENVQDYQLAKIGYKIGAPEFTMSYSTTRNGFQFQHLHQPYRPPTNDLFGNPITNAGNEAVGLPNFFRESDDPFPNPAPSTGGTDKSTQKTQCESGVLAPITRISGVIINNPALLTAERESDLTTQPAAGGCYLFKDYFSSEKEARKAWKKCIWARLGFSYEQLNSENHFELIKAFTSPAERLQGFTTNAEIDSTIQPSIAGVINPNTIFPSLGATGDGAKVDSIQTFNFIDMGTPRRSAKAQYPDTSVQSYNNIKQFAGNINSFLRTLLHITTADRPLVARNLPTLSSYGYYLITSDIVPNQDDIVGKGSPLPLLGVVPKTSLSSQDFIFTDNTIVHNLTNPTTINSIKISVLNPDLTAPELDENSSVIIKVVSPIEEELTQNDKVED